MAFNRGEKGNPFRDSFFRTMGFKIVNELDIQSPIMTTTILPERKGNLLLVTAPGRGPDALQEVKT